MKGGRVGAVALTLVLAGLWWLWPETAPPAALESDARRSAAPQPVTTELGARSTATADTPPSLAALVDEALGGVASGPPAEVAGRVIEGGSGELIPYVDVLFSSAGIEVTANSGSGGRYRTLLEPGQYRVRAVGEGVLGGEGEPLDVSPGAAIARDIEVARLATVRGRVVDDRGRPVARARVEYGPVTDAQKTHKKLGDWPSAVTSVADGSFELEVIGGGDVHIDAYADGRRGHALLRDMRPGDVRKGVVVKLDAGALLRGRVVDPGGVPVAGAAVQAYVRERRQHMTERRETETDATGHFAFERMISGVLTVEATAAGFAPSTPRPVKLAPGAEISIELALALPRALSGRVVDAAGDPVAGAVVTARHQKSQLPAAETSSAPDGSFSFSHLGAGPYDLVATSESTEGVSRDLEPPGRDIVLKLAPR